MQNNRKNTFQEPTWPGSQVYDKLASVPVLPGGPSSEAGEKSVAASFVLARVRLPRISALTRGVVSRRILTGASIGVRVSGRRGEVSAVRIVVATARRRVVVSRPTRRRPVTGTIVVILPSGAPITVALAISIPPWTIRTGRSASVVILRRGDIWASATGGPGPGSGVAWRRIWLGICDAVDTGAFEFAAIQFFNGGPQVGSSLKLDEASTVAVAARLGIDHIQAGLAGKVFQIQLVSVGSPVMVIR
jgi:hypothetical protein